MCGLIHSGPVVLTVFNILFFITCSCLFVCLFVLTFTFWTLRGDLGHYTFHRSCKLPKTTSIRCKIPSNPNLRTWWQFWISHYIQCYALELQHQDTKRSSGWFWMWILMFCWVPRKCWAGETWRHIASDTFSTTDIEYIILQKMPPCGKINVWAVNLVWLGTSSSRKGGDGDMAI